MKTTINAEAFEAATGSKPINDDLERANCPRAGQLGHWGCGWNEKRNLPRWMTAEFVNRGGLDAPDAWHEPNK